jgi:hypothetical protein
MEYCEGCERPRKYCQCEDDDDPDFEPDPGDDGEPWPELEAA